MGASLTGAPLFAKHPSRILDDAFSLVEAGANQAATGANDLPHPTQAQAIAGNYRMGRINLHGLDIRIENVRGSYREGVSPDGTAWRNRLAAHYGYFAGTRGADGDPVDVFVGPFPESESVWVINQRHVGRKTSFDETKVMLGFHAEQQARDAYMHSFDRGWTGLASIAPASLNQLTWWLNFGNHKIPFLAALPPKGETTMLDKVLWDSSAMPVTSPLHQVLYDLRVSDGAGLMLDACTLDDLMSDPDIEAIPVYDALVVEVASMTRKMTLLQKTMEAAGVAVKPAEMVIADPVKSRGVLQVMVLFTMSDGQTVSIWFHNPDTTPAKLTPMDELISWKWLINKKDVTIVVAPERGHDLNVREVSRRVMRLVEKNSEAFQKANAKAGERAAVTEALKTEIATLEGTLSGLQRQIEVAKVANEGRDVRGPDTAWNEYQALKSQNPDALLLHRMGDFYEAMGDDAKTVADALNLTLTRRNTVPMAGVPLFSLQSSIAALTAKGFKVAESDRDEAGKAFIKDVFGGVTTYTLKMDMRPHSDASNEWTGLSRADVLAQVSALSRDVIGFYKVFQENPWLDVTAEIVGEAKPAGDTTNPTYDPDVVSVYATKTGKEALIIQETVDASGRKTYQYNGAYGAGSGIAFSDMLKTVSIDKNSHPGMKLIHGVEFATLAGADTPIEAVDAAYKFDSATDAFKEWVADSVGDADYSPFVSAKAIDQKAKELGAIVAWDVSMAVLDGVAEEDDGEDFDADEEWEAMPESEEVEA